MKSVVVAIGAIAIATSSRREHLMFFLLLDSSQPFLTPPGKGLEQEAQPWQWLPAVWSNMVKQSQTEKSEWLIS